MNAVLSEDLATLLEDLGEERLAFLYMPANEDGLPELAAAVNALPPDVLAHFMAQADLDDMVMGQLGYEEGQLVFWANNLEHPSFAEHLSGVFAEILPALGEAELRAEEAGELWDEEEEAEEGDATIEDAEEEEPEEEDASVEDPSAEAAPPIVAPPPAPPPPAPPPPAPPPPAPPPPAPPPLRPLAERLNEALRAHAPVAVALDALAVTRAALDEARRPLLGALSALELHRRRFAEAVALVRAQTSVAGLKDAMKLLPTLVAAERATAAGHASLAPRLAAASAAAAQAESAAATAASEDPALASLLAEAASALPWAGVTALPSPDPAAVASAIAAVASRAPAIQDAARRYRSNAQSKSWAETVPDSLRAESAPLRQAALAGLRDPAAKPAQARVEAGLPTLADALGAARHARQWADRLPPERRALAEASQEHVAEEAATWLELGWWLGAVG